MMTRAPRRPVVVVLVISLFCALGFGYLWSRSGGRLPSGDGYRLAFLASDVKNLQDGGDVRVAGVKVGEVMSQEVEGDKVRVVVELDEAVAPLHDGATVRIGVKSLIGQSMVVVKDGQGAALPGNTVLPEAAVVPAVDIDELVGSFDPATRRAMAGALSNLGATTGGTGDSIAQLVDGLGRLGREGYTATDALAAQSKDLKALMQETTVILGSLNTRRAALVSLVEDSHRLTSAAAGQRDDLARTMQGLPDLMAAAAEGTTALGGLSQDLLPVVTDLDASAGDLNQALEQLPSVTRSLRNVMPPARSTLRRSDATLEQLPDFAGNLATVSPEVDVLLRNLNPVLGYLEPYSLDIGSFFGNFGGSFDFPVENGVRPARLAAVFTQQSLRNSPLKLPELNPLHYSNPYPAPGAADQVDRFDGTYPRVTRDR